MIKGKSTSQPSREDKLIEVEAKLQQMELMFAKGKDIPRHLKSPRQTFLGMDTPTNDAGLEESLEFSSDITKGKDFDQRIHEIFSRLNDIENRLPEFKGLNSFDGRIPFLPKGATQDDIISTINKIVQRVVSQDRLQ